jgi:galactonate dehydratase
VRITDIRNVAIDRYLFVKVCTDAGITGLGESGAWGYLEASAAAVDTFKRHLIGQDPLAIEHHWQYLYRWSHFRGAAIMGALSAIDIALWDIAGKHHGVPSYRLLGGPTRDAARVYAHVFAASVDEMAEGCRAAKARGFTAVGHLNPMLDENPEDPYFKTHVAKIEDAIDAVRRCREAVGDALDLCVEIHRRLTPAEAVVLARGIEPYHPMFMEDPTPPDNLDAMEEIANKIHVPIATGERLHTIFEFSMLLRRRAVQYVRPDVCMCGGITHAKKIAALAEANYLGVIPHNPLGPVSTAACVQLAACIPNFVIQEYPVWDHQAAVPQGAERLFGGSDSTNKNAVSESSLVRSPLELEDGFLKVPTAPGIGVELAEGVEQRHPYRSRRVVTRLHRDGSVVDQ